MDIRLGAMAPSLVEQLGDLGLSSKTLVHLQLDNEAISRLAIRGLITDSEAHRARKRLVKAIKSAHKEASHR